ncbi:MAG: hypothetical protein ABUL68_05250, partial [Pseudomonadota bacterium]
MNKTTLLRIAFLLASVAPVALFTAGRSADAPPPAQQPPRPTPPGRLPNAPGMPAFIAVGAKPGELQAMPGMNPPANADGDFLVGPDYVPAPELKAVEGVPQGKLQQFSMDSKDGKFYNPGIARDVPFGTVDPANPKTVIVETHPIDYKRTVTVYIPAQYVPGTAAPFIVTHDGPPLGRPDVTFG